MREAIQDPESSSFEEPEQEQVAYAGRVARRELLLGVCLLLIVVALAGWVWWQGETQLTAYRAGARAAEARDWDEARRRFVAAGDYSDAEARAAESARNIAARDKQYRLATVALADGDGVAALLALAALEEIEAGYADSALLGSRAKAQIYRGALEGMVAMRRDADPPGLYYRAAEGWIWLQGSDGLSSPRNLGNGGHVVYDVPAAGGAGNPRQGRRLVAAGLNGGSLSFAPVALDGRASVFWGEQGGWSYERGCRGPAPARLRSYFCASGMVYSASGSAITGTVRLPGPNWVVADLARDGGKMLVADPGDGESAQPHAGLYLAAPDGGDIRLLYSGAGWVERAAFSQDGRYVVATLGAVDGPEGTSYSAVLLDTSGGAAPRILSSARYMSHEVLTGMDFVILSGEGSGNVAVAEYGAGQTTLKIFDLGVEDEAARTFRVGQQLQQPLIATRVDGGGLLVCGRVAKVSVTLDPLNTDSGTCALIDGTEQGTRYDLPAIALFGIGYAWPRQGSIIYPVAMPQAGVAGVSVLRVTPAGAAGTADATGVILQLTLGAGEWLNVVAGESMLAYARHGQLHARTYDGSFDLLLEQGVDILYDVRGAANVTMLF